MYLNERIVQGNDAYYGENTDLDRFFRTPVLGGEPPEPPEIEKEREFNGSGGRHPLFWACIGASLLVGLVTTISPVCSHRLATTSFGRVAVLPGRAPEQVPVKNIKTLRR